MKKKFSKTQKLTISAMVMALYIVVLYFTQSFSFGAYQIRIATTLYALSYFCPFLVLPLGRKFNLPKLCIVPVLILIPGMGVATWLSYCLNIPYGTMAFSLCIGQTVPAVCGLALVIVMKKRFPTEKQSAEA